VLLIKEGPMPLFPWPGTQIKSCQFYGPCRRSAKLRIGVARLARPTTFTVQSLTASFIVMTQQPIQTLIKAIDPSAPFNS